MTTSVLSAILVALQAFVWPMSLAAGSDGLRRPPLRAPVVMDFPKSDSDSSSYASEDTVATESSSKISSSPSDSGGMEVTKGSESESVQDAVSHTSSGCSSWSMSDCDQ